MTHLEAQPCSPLMPPETPVQTHEILDALRTTSNLSLSAVISAWRVLLAAGGDADARCARGCETSSATRPDMLTATSEMVAGMVQTRHHVATWPM